MTVAREAPLKPTAFARLCSAVGDIAKRVIVVEKRTAEIDDLRARVARLEKAADR